MLAQQQCWKTLNPHNQIATATRTPPNTTIIKKLAKRVPQLYIINYRANSEQIGNMGTQ